MAFPSSKLVTVLLSVPLLCILPNRKKRLAQLYRQTTCFSLLWQIYSLNYFFHYKYYSHLAAMMQVNTALETQDDFQVGSLCSPFVNFRISLGGKIPAEADGASTSRGYKEELPGWIALPRPAVPKHSAPESLYTLHNY